MKITSAKQLSSHLKDVRKQQGLSQYKAADKVGIKQDTVSKFEISSDHAQIATFFKLLSSLNLELEIKPRSQHLNVKPTNPLTPNDNTTEWNEEW